MAVQIIDLETIQMGIETTRGTLVAATHVVDFVEASLKIDRRKIRTARSGSLATGHRSDNGIVDYEISVKTVGTFDRIACFLPMFLAPTITGTGGSADKTWTFTPNDVADDLKSCSLEVGGNDAWPTDFKFAGCVGRTLTVEINSESLWAITWTFGAMKKTNASKTGALAAPSASLVDIVGFGTKVYIDTTTMHTTQLSNEMLKGKFTIDLGTRPRHYLGSTTGEAGAIQQLGRRKVSWDLVGDWLATTELAAFEADTLRKVSLETVGPVLGGSNYSARFDFVGSNDTWEQADEDGGVVQHLTGMGKYDATLGADVKAVIVNSIASVP